MTEIYSRLLPEWEFDNPSDDFEAATKQRVAAPEYWRRALSIAEPINPDQPFLHALVSWVERRDRESEFVSLLVAEEIASRKLEQFASAILPPRLIYVLAKPVFVEILKIHGVAANRDIACFQSLWRIALMAINHRMIRQHFDRRTAQRVAARRDLDFEVAALGDPATRQRIDGRCDQHQHQGP